MMVSFSRLKRRHIRWDAVVPASSVPNTRDSSAKPPGLRTLVMRLVGIHVIVTLVILGLGRETTSANIPRQIDKRSGNVGDESVVYDDSSQSEIEADTVEEDDLDSEDNLPILPPIILLDFGNGTEEENPTSEDKSKRTVNGGLGYGFERNALHGGRYNYYFPAGKTGTTVSIEESISPFLPKTIIEKIPSSSQTNNADKNQQKLSHQNFYNSPAALRSQSHQNRLNAQYSNVDTSPRFQQIFGLRTKLHKAPAATSYQFHQSFASSTPAPVSGEVSPYGYSGQLFRNTIVPSASTPSSLSYSPTESVVHESTSNPLTYTGTRGSSYTYAKQNSNHGHRTSGISQIYSRQKQNVHPAFGHHNHNSQNHAYVESSTMSPLSYDNGQLSETSSQYSSTPKYTIENGVRYEHKIFWKYPDGRVSDTPPPTYVETYSEVPQSSRSQPAKSESSFGIYESGSTENSVHSQGPVQFPVVPELSGQEPSPFISSESLSSSLPQQQVYRLGYQSLVTQKQTAGLVQRAKTNNAAAAAAAAAAATYNSASSGSSSPSSSSANVYSSRVPSTSVKSSRVSPKNNYRSSTYLRPQVISRYMINSPDAEYTESPRSTTPSPSLFASSASNNSKKQSTSGKNSLGNYSNLRYSDLLNYNPSISQYIRNPSSILNVHPTFVQTGNSLIPVIILRVDGTPPIEQATTPNINLKALLQQYLIQYANSIQELARPSSNYDFGGEQYSRSENSSPSRSQLLDLIQLTRNDGREPVAHASETYAGKSSYETSNLEALAAAHRKYGERTSTRQKVKSVQIVEDPKSSTYKTQTYRNAS